MTFESNLEDVTSPVAIDFCENKNVLLIAFAGLAGKLAIPMFEFNQSTKELENVNKIYLRDHKRLWYHAGLYNVGNNIESIANYLRRYTTHSSTNKVVVIGSSGGGYAALLFGHILQADEVHAFSAKTTINPILRFMRNDLPKRNRLKRMLYLLSKGEKRYFNIERIFRLHPNHKTSYHIYFSCNHERDTFHALRVKHIPNVHLHPYEYNRHNLVAFLKKEGELSSILKQAISL
ncbi:Uncharacterised protein [BD1-7 clade bacterium]|nr:Uncharacterised protein [BD1-7 clade bacterium]